MLRRFGATICIASILGVALYTAPDMVRMVTPALGACSDTANRGVNWSGCRKRNIIMSDFDFSGADFTRADLSSSDLRNSNLNNTKFEKANLVRASLRGASAKEANFTNVVASRTDFSASDLSDANLSKAETNRVNFSNANLNGADLSKAEFARAKFSGANLSGVKFDYSNLARSDLRGAKFETPPTLLNAYLFQTRIEGLDLSALTDLEPWQIQLACGDDATKLPAGMSRPTNWPCVDIEEDL